MTRDEYRNQRIKEYETYLSCKSDDEDDTLEEQIQSQQTKPVAENEVMDLSTANIPGSISFKITSMTCAQQVLFAGGFQGECTWKSLDSDSPIQYLSNANTASGITNYTDIIQDRKGVVLGIVSNNDASIKYINLTTAQIQTTWTLPFAVNVGSPSLVFFSYMLIISF